MLKAAVPKVVVLTIFVLSDKNFLKLGLFQFFYHAIYLVFFFSQYNKSYLYISQIFKKMHIKKRNLSINFFINFLKRAQQFSKKKYFFPRHLKKLSKQRLRLKAEHAFQTYLDQSIHQRQRFTDKIGTKGRQSCYVNARNASKLKKKKKKKRKENRLRMDSGKL